MAELINAVPARARTDTVNQLLHALWESPGDRTCRAAVEDALQECGLSAAAARRRAGRVISLATQGRAIALAAQLLQNGGVMAHAIRDRIRAAAGTNSRACPIRLLSGWERPKLVGREGYHTFAGTDVVAHSPGGARAAGYRLDYHHSTRALEVGARWILGLRILRSILPSLFASESPPTKSA